jgi:hypothetical protein
MLTFIVSHDGVVYQKDLGPDSLNIVKQMVRSNPDKTWKRTDDEWRCPPACFWGCVAMIACHPEAHPEAHLHVAGQAR